MVINSAGIRHPNFALRVAYPLFIFWIAGCASIPGKTGLEQEQTLQELVDTTLADLYREQPAAREQVLHSFGYVIMRNKITKIPVFGIGAGHGVGIEAASGQKAFLIMRRFDVGAGWGARGVRTVLVFRLEKPFRDFIDGTLEAKLGAEAAAKVGDTGTAGGADTPKSHAQDPGYSSYLLTDNGVSATVTFGVIRVKPVKLKKR